MKKHYGPELIREASACMHRITLSLNPRTVSFKWDHCGLISNLLANYTAIWHAQHSTDAESILSYCVNELVENAIKFTTHGNILLQMDLLPERGVLLSATNMTGRKQALRLANFVEENFCLHRSSEQQLLRMMEQNANTPFLTQSKLGFLSMACDHKALLCWTLSPLNKSCIRITTRVKIFI